MKILDELERLQRGNHKDADLAIAYGNMIYDTAPALLRVARAAATILPMKGETARKGTPPLRSRDFELAEPEPGPGPEPGHRRVRLMGGPFEFVDRSTRWAGEPGSGKPELEGELPELLERLRGKR